MLFKMEQFTIVTIALISCGLLTSNVDASPHLDSNPIVATKLGQIQGIVMNTRLDRPFYAFRGIRYAQPPVGDLRFRAPVPVDAWSDVFDATVDGPSCAQYRADNDYSDTSEDCLMLNVYAHDVS